jgi:HAD superfamily hydrolase (TIGR01490 family)
VSARAAAFFDLDKTVIAKSSTLAFSRPFYRGGLVNRRAVLKSSFAQFVYLLQGADEDSMDRMRDYLKTLCAGWPVDQVNAIVAETLHELIDPMVYAEAVALFDQHRAAGLDIVIVSSSGEEVVGPIGDMLGVDHVIATRMVVADGKYTGEIAFYAYGEGKARRSASWPPSAATTSRSAGPTATPHRPADAGAGRQPGGRQPDKSLRRHAAENGWRLREFRRPVRVRTARMPAIPAPPGPPAAYAGVAVAAGAVGLAWWAGRRH